MLSPALYPRSSEISRTTLRAAPELFELPTPHLIKTTSLDGVARVLGRIEDQVLPTSPQSISLPRPQVKPYSKSTSIPLPQAKPSVRAALHLRPEFSQAPFSKTAPLVPPAVAALRLQMNLAMGEERPRLSSSLEPGRPRGEVAQMIYDEASVLREDMVYGRHLVEAIPDTVQRNIDRVIEPAKILWQGGPRAQQLIQDVKYEASLFWDDLLNDGGTKTRAVLSSELDRIEALKQENKLSEAAALELEHHLKTAIVAAPVVGALWGIGAGVLAGGAALYQNGLILRNGLSKLEKIKKVVASKIKTDFSTTLKAGAIFTALGTAAATAYEGKPLNVYYHSNENRRGISSMLGAPAGVKDISITFGPHKASVWWGQNVTVGTGLPEWRRTETKRKKSKNNHGVSEQHKSMFVIGGGAHFGGDYNAAWYSRTAQFGNSTLTIRNDPDKELGRHSAAQGDFSFLYSSTTSGIAAGPLFIGRRNTNKGKHFQATASENRSGVGGVGSKGSNYGTARINPVVLHPKELDSLKPIFSIDLNSWWAHKNK